MSNQDPALRAGRDAFGHLLMDHLDGKPLVELIEREAGLVLPAGESAQYLLVYAE